MERRDKTAWKKITDEQRQQISEANDLMLASFQNLFVDTSGLPEVLEKEEEIEEFRRRVVEAAPQCAVAVDGFLRGISISDYIRNLLTARMIQDANKYNK